MKTEKYSVHRNYGFDLSEGSHFVKPCVAERYTYTCNMQCDAQNSECYTLLSALMQPI